MNGQPLEKMSISGLIQEYNSLDWACTSDDLKNEQIREMQNRQADVMAEATRRDRLIGRSFENTTEDIDAMLADVVVQMKSKLLLTRHRPHWSKSDDDFLMSRLHDEVKELDEAYEQYKQHKISTNRKAVISELADVMNFAAFVMDNLMNAGTRPWDSKEGA